jgi:hypothetical protein
MNTAKVLSLEALQQFYLDLQTFRTAMLREVENLELELRRLTHWIESDATNYWQSENQIIRRRLEEYLQQLSRCMSYVREDERRPCTEEKKRVAKAKDRAALCESKLRIAEAATTQWQAKQAKVRTKLQRCRDMAESDMLVALNRLQTHISRLENYSQLRSPVPRDNSVLSNLPDNHPATEPSTVERLPDENLSGQQPSGQRQSGEGDTPTPAGADY